MSNETTYKAFVAETSAKIIASICSAYMSHGDTTLLRTPERQDLIISVSITIAKKLADGLEEWWKAMSDGSTEMFDVSDSLTSRIEEGVDKIAEHIKSFAN